MAHHPGLEVKRHRFPCKVTTTVHTDTMDIRLHTRLHTQDFESHPAELYVQPPQTPLLLRWKLRSTASVRGC